MLLQLCFVVFFFTHFLTNCSLRWPRSVKPAIYKSTDTLLLPSATPVFWWAREREREKTWGWLREVCVCVCWGGIGRKWGLFVLCYLADISSMCRLASWQAETTGALGMLSVQEISFILINAAPNPLLQSCWRAASCVWCVHPHCPFLVSQSLSLLLLLMHWHLNVYQCAIRLQADSH